MPKKNSRNTKGRIISAAWKLFYENGYDATTIEDIIFASGTSRGSFYHYFEGKNALLGTLAYVFDEKYEQLRDTLDPEWNAADKLIFLNRELFTMIEESISRDLLSGLLSTQLQAQGEKHLLDRNRIYFRILREIITEGQKRKGRRDVGEGAHVRLVPVRGRVFPGSLRRENDAHVPRKLPQQRRFTISIVQRIAKDFNDSTAKIYYK